MSTNLSGSVGYTLLELNNTPNNMHVLLLADIHDGINYCTMTNSEMVASWLNKKSNNNTILLEEIIREKFKLTPLWPNSQHTSELQQLKETNDKIIPIDIRPMLIPFSWELINKTTEIGNMKLVEYIGKLVNLFNKKSEFYNKYFKHKIDKMMLTQLNLKKSKVSPLVHYNELNILFNNFLDTYKNNMNDSIYNIKTSNINILYKINNLISLIMEWYIVLLIHDSDYKHSIIHIGLAHSNHILDILIMVYRFKIIEQKGINLIQQIKSDTPSACLIIPSHINNMYNNKYGMMQYYS
jgi:hypothetical protein